MTDGQDKDEAEKREAAMRMRLDAQAQTRGELAAIPGHELVSKIAEGLRSGLIGSAGGAASPGLGVIRDELTMFSGFISDELEQQGARWRLLFTDPTANQYVVISADDIVAIDPSKDQTAPFGRLDYVWIKANARVVQGDTSQSLDGLLTAGAFTRAGDFRGSFSGASSDPGMSGLGPLCTARTPCCCNKRTA